MDKHDHNEIYFNEISPPLHVEHASKNPVGDATKNPYCIYANQKHAVGSKIKNMDGSKTVCTEDGTWQN